MNDKVKSLLPYIIIIIVVVFIKLFIMTPIRVNGESMSPTLEEKDIMILNKTLQKYIRYAIIRDVKKMFRCFYDMSIG